MCLNARSIINKKTELNIMVDDVKPHIIGITESWANNDITDAELGLEGYVMFRKDRMGRRGLLCLVCLRRRTGSTTNDRFPGWSVLRCCHGITQGHMGVVDDLVSPAESWASSWAAP